MNGLVSDVVKLKKKTDAIYMEREYIKRMQCQ